MAVSLLITGCSKENEGNKVESSREIENKIRETIFDTTWFFETIENNQRIKINFQFGKEWDEKNYEYFGFMWITDADKEFPIKQAQTFKYLWYARPEEYRDEIIGFIEIRTESQTITNSPLKLIEFINAYTLLIHWGKAEKYCLFKKTV
jgi:hypothetical protein